jgi:hypothetical protein
LFEPPARPSAAEVAIYAERAGQEAPGSDGWLLFGSTPEIRSLAARRGRPLVCIDSDPAVFRALGALVDSEGPHELVAGDWLEVDIDGRFDVAFADGSLNMLPRTAHAPFLRRVHALLADGGLALLRVHVASPPRFAQAAEVFAWHREHTSGSLFSRTRTDLDMLWLDPDTLTVDFGDYHRRIHELHRRGEIRDAEREAYDRLLDFNRIRLHYTTREEFERLTAEIFEIEHVFTGDDYFGAGNHPVYALRRA